VIDRGQKEKAGWRERGNRERGERERDDESSKGRAPSEGVWEQKTICKARLRTSLTCLLFASTLCSLLKLMSTHTHTHTHTFDESELGTRLGVYDVAVDDHALVWLVVVACHFSRHVHFLGATYTWGRRKGHHVS
jgi:hypothetical protein